MDGGRPAADPAPQLVQLGQAEALGVLDHHDRGVRDVDAHLDHRGGDEDLDLPAGEGAPSPLPSRRSSSGRGAGRRATPGSAAAHSSDASVAAFTSSSFSDSSTSG